MATPPKERFGARLVRAMEEVVAIHEGRLEAPRRYFRTAADAKVAPPPRYGAARVRRVREHLGMSQPVFAKALNVSVATVRGWEQGMRVPDGASRRLLDLAERNPETIFALVR